MMGMIPQQQLPIGAPGAYMQPRVPMGMYQQNPQQMQQQALMEQFQHMGLGGPGGAGRIGGGNQMSKQKRKERMNEVPSLYVSNLPRENFFDLDFQKFFENRGYRVKKAKIVLDSKTSKSRGYGYLQFYTEEELTRCLDNMNNVQLQGQALRIVRSTANPKSELFDEQANLLVKNIDKEITQQALHEVFKTHGDIVSCKLETYPDGKTSRGYAYVQYKTKESAEAAVQALNGVELNGKKLEVLKHEKRDKTKTSGTTETTKTPVSNNNLFVKNLPEGTTDAQL